MFVQVALKGWHNGRPTLSKGNTQSCDCLADGHRRLGRNPQTPPDGHRASDQSRSRPAGVERFDAKRITPLVNLFARPSPWNSDRGEGGFRQGLGQVGRGWSSCSPGDDWRHGVPGSLWWPAWHRSSGPGPLQLTQQGGRRTAQLICNRTQAAAALALDHDRGVLFGTGWRRFWSWQLPSIGRCI